MSGGSYDYFCYRLDDFIEEFGNHLNNDPLRAAFHEHLKKVRKAVYDIEWVDSGDYGSGREIDAIKACLEPTGLDERVKDVLRSYANTLLNLIGDESCQS